MYSFYFSLRGNKNVPIQVIYIFGGIGLLAFASSYFLQSLSGLILFLSYPILFFLIKQHLQIDFATKMCRLGIDFMGFTFGKWKPLPTIEYISVFRKQYRNNSFEDSGELHWDETFEKVEVNLILNRRETLNVWVGDDKLKAIEAAKFIGKKLNLRVLDATQREFIWLDE